MKRSVFLLLPLLVIACTNTEPEQVAKESKAIEKARNHWQNEHLKGDVKTIIETPYKADAAGEIAEMDSCCIVVSEFNSMGYSIKTTEKNSMGEVTGVNVVEHTEGGEFVSSTWTRNGKEVWKRTVTRDEEGNVISAFDTDSSMQMTTYYITDVYNDFNQPVSGKSYAADSTFDGTWSWQYIDGLRTGRGWKNSNGVQVLDRTGEVNERGWLSKVVDTRKDGKGGLTTIVETYTYTSFDEMGNWTQCTLSENGAPVKIMKRVYSYY